MANTNIINAVFGSGICAVTTSAFRANYGMVLRFSGIDLPTAFECDFSNYDVMGRDSITAIGQNGEVQIPDDMWDSGLNIYAFVYLHPTDDSGVTVYTVTIPVLGRPNRTDETPTPHEQTVIEQAISALNDAVEQTAADVVAADASASAAAQSEANASVSERSAAASASAALASQNAAESAAQSATESASGADESAQIAANSASQAAESATSAQESAEQAERSVQSITDDVERAERAANTATGKATEASGSAATANAKATEAAQSAQSAASSAQNAASSAQSAESSATDAEQAKLDAQDAQAAAEAAAESVSGLSAQIAQNTADIAELVQSKAGALIDTASGSIASFVPDATIPTVKGLTVDIEPVQDLHGYDHPWPAGGGKNKFDPNSTGNMWVGSDMMISYQPLGKSVQLSSSEGQSWSASMSNVRTSTNLLIIVFFDGNNNVLSRNLVGAGSKTLTATAPANTETVLCSLYRYSEAGDVQLELGSTTTDYEPYSNICPISGWDGVEVTRTGKNLIRTKVNGRTTAGITFSVREDSSVVANGTATGSAWLTSRITDRNLLTFLKAGTYTVTGGKSTNMVCYLGGEYVDGSYFPGNYDRGNGATFTLTADAWVYPQIQIMQGQTCNNEVFNFQLELGSTATAYEPYQGDTYTIQLGQTVYGGTLDVTNGVLTVDRAMVVIDGVNKTVRENGTTSTTSNAWFSGAVGKAYGRSNFISNRFATGVGTVPGGMTGRDNSIGVEFLLPLDVPNNVSALNQWFADNPTQLCYELAAPITIDLTPLEISVLTGQTNNIWADSGDVSVDYAADLKTYINNKIAAAVAALS